jgi:hypothetical protein
MELVDAFYQSGVHDCYTFVFSEHDPRTGFYTMLATSETGRSFSQWTEGMYDPAAENEHLGERRLFAEIGKTLMDHVFGRMAE